MGSRPGVFLGGPEGQVENDEAPSGRADRASFNECSAPYPAQTARERPTTRPPRWRARRRNDMRVKQRTLRFGAVKPAGAHFFVRTARTCGARRLQLSHLPGARELLRVELLRRWASISRISSSESRSSEQGPRLEQVKAGTQAPTRAEIPLKTFSCFFTSEVVRLTPAARGLRPGPAAPSSSLDIQCTSNRYCAWVCPRYCPPVIAGRRRPWHSRGRALALVQNARRVDALYPESRHLPQWSGKLGRGQTLR